MDNLRIAATSLISAVMFSGCATQATSTFNYTKPSDKRHTNEIIVNKPFETVWSGLIKQLSKSFFVVNNVEKESRIINVSFSSDTPENFIDCGITDRTFERGEEKQVYRYSAAADSAFKLGRKPQNNANNIAIVDYIQRQTDLAGRINIYVAPTSDNDTEVSVNTKYILTIKVSGQAQGINVYDQVVATSNIEAKDYNVSFTTNTSGSSGEIACVSKGALENDILEMVRAI